MGWVSAVWILEAVGVLYISFLAGAFGTWPPVAYLGIAKSIVVLTFAVGISQLRTELWAPAVAVPALYLGVSSLLVVWPLIMLSKGLSRGEVSLLLNSVFLYALHGVVLGIISRKAWRSYEAFRIPKHQRWRYLVRIGIPFSLAMLLVDLIILVTPRIRR